MSRHALACVPPRTEALQPPRSTEDRKRRGSDGPRQGGESTDALAGKVVLVTGAAKGMGNAISFVFAPHGAWVAIAARRIEDAQRVAAEIGDAALGLTHV